MIGRPLLAGLSAVPVAVLTATPAVAWLTDSVQIGTAVLVPHDYPGDLPPGGASLPSGAPSRQPHDEHREPVDDVAGDAAQVSRGTGGYQTCRASA